MKNTHYSDKISPILMLQLVNTELTLDILFTVAWFNVLCNNTLYFVCSLQVLNVNLQSNKQSKALRCSRVKSTIVLSEMLQSNMKLSTQVKYNYLRNSSSTIIIFNQSSSFTKSSPCPLSVSIIINTDMQHIRLVHNSIAQLIFGNNEPQSIIRSDLPA